VERKKRSGFMKTLKVKILLFSFLLGVFGESLLFADTSHYKDLLVGARAATMGGAYAAIADDATGAYYNPAGLVYSPGSVMTGIANSYHFTFNEYEKTVQGQNEERDSTEYFPNFLGYMKRMGNVIAGFSFALNDSIQIEQNQTLFDTSNVNYYTIVNRKSKDNTYQFGPTVAYKASEKFSIGGTFYYYQREYSLQYSNLERSVSGDYWKYENTAHSELGWTAKLGMMWAPVKPLSIGLVVAKTFPIYAVQIEQVSLKNTGSLTTSFFETKTHEQRKFPTQVTLGIAYFPTPYLVISTDLDYYVLHSTNKTSVLNVSAGIEYFINERNSLKAGLYTNYDNDIEPTSTTTSTEKIDLFGITGGFSIYSGPTTITIGAIYSRGVGHAQEIDNSSAIQTVTRQTFTSVLAVSYTMQ
jgi:hypothetical protein